MGPSLKRTKISQSKGFSQGASQESSQNIAKTLRNIPRIKIFPEGDFCPSRDPLLKICGKSEQDTKQVLPFLPWLLLVPVMIGGNNGDI